jgi:hypothetical protein
MRDPRVIIVSVEPLHDHWVRATFADGAIHEIDLGPTFARGGVFSPIYDDRSVFESVRVDPETDTLLWPGEVDLDPWVLRGLEAPMGREPLTRRVVQHA